MFIRKKKLLKELERRRESLHDAINELPIDDNSVAFVKKWSCYQYALVQLSELMTWIEKN